MVLPRRVRLHPVAGGRVSGIPPRFQSTVGLTWAGAFTGNVRGVDACYH